MFASPSDRLALRNSNPSFGLDFVVQFEKGGRQSELCADDVDHALVLQKQWIDAGSDYVEIFRVLDDGSLKPTIGGYRK
jgi:hypothetical protein